MKTFRERFQEFFRPDSVELKTELNESSTLQQIASAYPETFPFLERKYGMKLEAQDRTLTLKHFAEKYGLPPAQILFMEVQMQSRVAGVKAIRPLAANQLMAKLPNLAILDVREEWEMKITRIPGAFPLTPQLLDTILSDWPKNRPVLVYCHFGVRSLDAATFLKDRGFTEVYSLEGGIDGWAAQVDKSLPRYQGNYC